MSKCPPLLRWFKYSIYFIKEKQVAKDKKITWRDLSDRELIELLRGIKRIQTVGGEKAIEGMKIKDVVEAGKLESDEKKVAQIILKKTGRKSSDRKKALLKKSSKYKEVIKDKDLKSKVLSR